MKLLCTKFGVKGVCYVLQKQMVSYNVSRWTGREVV